MILALLAAAAGQSAAPQWYRDGEFPTAEAVLAMVEDCGVAEAEIGFDDLLQSDAVTLPVGVALSDEQLGCLAETAFETGYEILLPEQYVPEFYALQAEIAEPWNHELASQHLAEMGKLESLTKRGPEETDAQFATRLERYCDAPGALSSEFGPHAISPNWISRHDRDFSEVGLASFCLMNAGAVSDFQIGFIGNEAFVEVDSESGR